MENQSQPDETTITSEDITADLHRQLSEKSHELAKVMAYATKLRGLLEKEREKSKMLGKALAESGSMSAPAPEPAPEPERSASGRRSRPA